MEGAEPPTALFVVCRDVRTARLYTPQIRAYPRCGAAPRNAPYNASAIHAENEMAFNPKLYHEKYRIPSARAEWWEYYGGMYFVTIVTKYRNHYFGKIMRSSKNGVNQMELSNLGKFVDSEIPKIMDHYWYAYIPVWTVMPNHIHMIVMIDKRGRENPNIRDKSPEISASDISPSDISPFMAETCGPHVSTGNDTTIESGSIENDTTIENVDETIYKSDKRTREFMASISPKTGSLAIVMNQFKRAITIYARKNKIPFAWQPRYHEEIFKTQREFDNIRRYIENNVKNWNTDHFHK